jgi:hypothetical protein
LVKADRDSGTVLIYMKFENDKIESGDKSFAYQTLMTSWLIIFYFEGG